MRSQGISTKSTRRTLPNEAEKSRAPCPPIRAVLPLDNSRPSFKLQRRVDEDSRMLDAVSK